MTHDDVMVDCPRCGEKYPLDCEVIGPGAVIGECPCGAVWCVELSLVNKEIDE